ncbi:MAG: nucleotide sugar dehydrogenase, partial [Acidobacteriota bacterium]|nr:nucleotide sugar dehydrogenase [Acidobacteriota bacterium]
QLGAEVRVADPHVAPRDVPCVPVPLSAGELAAADAVVLVTDHDAFDYELVRRCASYVLDTRNRMAGDNVERL